MIEWAAVGIVEWCLGALQYSLLILCALVLFLDNVIINGKKLRIHIIHADYIMDVFKSEFMDMRLVTSVI